MARVRLVMVGAALAALALILVPGLGAAANENRNGPGFQSGSWRGEDCLAVGVATVTIDRAASRVHFQYDASAYDAVFEGTACGSHGYSFQLANACTENGPALHCLYNSAFYAELTIDESNGLVYRWRNCYDQCLAFEISGALRNR